MRAVAAALLVATAAGCAGAAAGAPPAPVTFSPGLVGLRVRVRRAPAPLDQEVAAAPEAELARGGVAVAGAYSLAHLTSSAGLVSWIHLVSVYVGPRLSF